MGRQGRDRFIKTQVTNELKSKKDSVSDDGYHITIIQRAFRAIQARARVDKLREEELAFLGMKQCKKVEDVQEEKLREENRERRKMIQRNQAKNMDDMRLKLNKELRDKESNDMENKE